MKQINSAFRSHAFNGRAFLVFVLCSMAALFGVKGAARYSVSAVASTPCVAAPGTRCERWTNTYDNPQYGAFDVLKPFAIAVSAATGRVFETGVIAGLPSNQYATVAYDGNTGTLLWTAIFSSPDIGDAESFAIAVSADGTRVYVTGHDDFYNGSAVGTVAYDAANGQQLWADTYHLGTYASGVAIGVSGDGNRVYVGGTAFGGPTNYGFLTIGYDATTGQRIWEQTYSGPGHGSDGITSLVVDPASDRVFVTGHSGDANSNSDFATIAYAGATGENLWTARWSGGSTPDSAAQSFPKAITLNPNGTRVFVTGYSNEDSGGTSTDFVTVDFNAATGTQEWVSHYTGPTIGDAAASAIAASPDGTKVFVTGRVPGPLGTSGCLNDCGYHYATVAYDLQSGNQLWVSNYGVDYAYTAGSVRAGATGVAVSPDSGTVYVSGIAYNGGATFAAGTLGLDAISGVQKWAARYIPVSSGADSAIPGQVVVNPATGQVFVGALFEHEDPAAVSGYYDYGIITYAGDGLVAAASRKTHDIAGTFDVRLPLVGKKGIECRVGATAGIHHVVFQFAAPVTVTDATVTPANGKTAEKDGPPTLSPDGTEVTVNLKNVSNAQLVTISLLGVNDGTTTRDVSVSMNVLAGDTTADGFVNSGDIAQTKSQSGVALTNSNFREDVTADGAINSGDIAFVKSKSGTALP